RRALEETTGRGLGVFFDQWIASAGHPEIEATSEWQPEAGQLRIELTQQQSGEQVPESFSFDLEIGVLEDGEWRLEKHRVDRRHQTLSLSCSACPEAVTLDPRDRLLGTWQLKRPPAALTATLAGAPWGPARAEAALALSSAGPRSAVDALGHALAKDGSWRVAAAAARALAQHGGEAATGLLAKGLGHAHPKVRRACAAGLGQLRGDKAVKALEKLLKKGDASYFVESEAAVSLGRCRAPGARATLGRVLRRKKGGWNDVLRRGALEGLGLLGSEESDEVVALLLPWTDKKHHERSREMAMASLARIGASNGRVRERLEELTEDGALRIDLAAVRSLSRIGDRRSVPALARLAERTLDGRIRRAAREALRRLESEGSATDVGASLAELRSENQALRERIERLERILEVPGT
ncbi:MAG: HEAT repeat domain-containing protein, partial [Acidobacteriota bacterium]